MTWPIGRTRCGRPVSKTARAASTSRSDLGLTTAGSAAADSTDDAFLHRVAADGLMFSLQQAVIQRARVVCEAFSTGASPASVHATMLNNSAMSPRQTALFMADAVQAYCPKYADLLFS
jgi:hypothetical protein